MDEEELKDRLWETRFRVGYSVRYHRDRERILDLWDKGAKAIAVIGGTATVTTLVAKSPNLVLWLGVAIALTSTLSLVFGLSQRARLHSDLARRFLDLDSRIAGEATPDAKHLAKFEMELATIERDEPPSLVMLVQDCQNREAIARGLPDHVHPISSWNKFFMHFFSFGVQPKPQSAPKQS